MAEVGFAVCGAFDVVPGEIHAAAGAFFADGLEEVHVVISTGRGGAEVRCEDDDVDVVVRERKSAIKLSHFSDCG